MSTALRLPRSRALAAALRKARQDKSMSLRELASRLSMDQSYLSKVETGKKPANVELTALILGVLQVTPDERERVLNLARKAAEPNWLAVGMRDLPTQLAGAMESEREASAIVEWAPMALPGLLQTADYARSLAEQNKLRKQDVESRVTVRIARREVLNSRKSVQFEGLISEVALREPMGPPDVMTEQLRYIMKMSTEPNVTIRVVPLGTGWHPGAAGPFVLYEFPDAPPFVHFEHYSSGAFVAELEDVEAYRKAIDMIEACALEPEDTANLIAKVIVDEWST